MKSLRNGLLIFAFMCLATSTTQADWLGSWHTTFSRWTGYGFGDGYHRCDCPGSCQRYCAQASCQSGCDSGYMIEELEMSASPDGGVWAASNVPLPLTQKPVFSQQKRGSGRLGAR